MRKQSRGSERLYYAHPICIYGRVAERRELAIIRRKFRDREIVNPADYRYEPEKVRDTIGFCLRLVAGSDVVVFSRLLGKVTAGVGKEVNHALRLGKPVYEIVARGVVRRERKVAYITRRQTVALYKRWRRRQWRPFP